jgi:hypothetical protein
MSQHPPVVEVPSDTGNNMSSRHGVPRLAKPLFWFHRAACFFPATRPEQW